MESMSIKKMREVNVSLKERCEKLSEKLEKGFFTEDEKEELRQLARDIDAHCKKVTGGI